MALIDVATAKRELRLSEADDDADVQRKLNTAQAMAEAFLGRRIYETPEDLTAAIASAPTALAAASTAYDTALETALALTVQTERELGESMAEELYRDASGTYLAAMRGIVINDQIRTGILLITAALWEHRGDEVHLEGVPKAAQSILWPLRAGMGV